EAASELRQYLEGIEFNPARLEQVQERLELYRALKRKYGDTAEDILAYREQAAAELDTLSHSEELRDELGRRWEALAREVDAASTTLFEARRAASERFEMEIQGHLADLNMAGTRFAVRREPPA